MYMRGIEVNKVKKYFNGDILSRERNTGCRKYMLTKTEVLTLPLG